MPRPPIYSRSHSPGISSTWEDRVVKFTRSSWPVHPFMISLLPWQTLPPRLHIEERKSISVPDIFLLLFGNRWRGRRVGRPPHIPGGGYEIAVRRSFAT